MSIFPFPVPDLDKYKAVPSTDGACTGCVFRKMRVRCSAIPCQRSVRRGPVIYVEKEEVKSCPA